MGEKEWQRSFVFYKLGFSSTSEGGIHRKCEEGPFPDSVVAYYQYCHRQLISEEFGWKMDTDNKSLSPIGLPDDTNPAPDYI